MATERTERRLAAILFTDIVGSTRLTAESEQAGLVLRDRHRALVRAQVERYQGRFVEAPGDETLSVFASAVDAVNAALAIRHQLEGDPELRLSLGLHLGEILFRNGEVYGDSVNLAARVRAVAQPGEIFATGELVHSIRGQPNLETSPRGEHKLKNVGRPITLYAIEGTPAAPRIPTSPLISRWASRTRQGGLRRRVLGMLAFLILAGVTWRLLLPEAYRPKPEAEELFLQADALASHSSSHLEDQTNNAAVIELLERAVTIDPNFAEAHAKLGLAYVIRLFLFAPEEKQLQQSAFLAIERSLRLNPNLAEAYEARARLRWTAFNHFPHQDAIRDFQRALELNPDLDETHHYLGLVFLHIGLIEEGRQEFMEAIRRNPSNNGAQYRIGESYFYEGNYREALKIFDTIDPAFNPDLHASQSAWAQFRLGQREEAILRIEKSLQGHPGDKGGLLASVQAMIHAETGETDAAEAAIQRASRRRDFGHFHHTEYNIASAYALMNNPERAIEWFEKAVHEGLNCYPMFEIDPSLENLRGHERFKSILADERRKWEAHRASFSKDSGSGQPLARHQIRG